MPLTAGTKIGPYVVVDLLGSGGMGEVYRAHDSRLKRDVALKVLPEVFSLDPELMERFDREAQVLASVNHPGIASIYGFEESQNVRAIVMELVEGSTLAERIARGPIPLAEALSTARQIAEALEFAHERGIVHRDLKPANVKLTPGDSVKLLDFGLAKALSRDRSPLDSSSSPTLTAQDSRAGLILGTPAYMSPEQARGRPVDRRADIWSFGCVLLEMLTGKPVFAGETVTDTLAAVLTSEPRAEALPASTPPEVRRLIHKCLEKDCRKRLQAIGDARIEIEDLLSRTSSPGLSAMPGGEPPASSATKKATGWLIGSLISGALLVVLAAALFAAWLRDHTAQSSTWTGDMISGPNVALGARISPDGHTLAFQAMIDSLTQVAVGDPNTGNWTVLTQDRQHGFVNEISWAADGSKLYYDRTIGTPTGIYSVPALGGAERLVLEDAGSPEVLPDGSLLVIRAGRHGRWQIYHYWPDAQRLEPLPGWLSIGTTIPLRVFSDGKEAVFYGATSENSDSTNLQIMDTETGKVRVLTKNLPNHIGESYPIATASDGRGVLVDVSAGDLHRIVELPRDGKGSVQTILTLTEAPWYMDMARDGTLYLDQVDRPHEILRFPVTGGQPEVVAAAKAPTATAYMAPVETPDGHFLLDTDFAGRPRLLIGQPGAAFVPLLDTNEATSGPAISLGNNQIALIMGEKDTATVAIVSVVDGRLIRRLAGTRGRNITSLAIAPDARTLYFGARGFIWSIPVSDGTAQKIAAGEVVNVSPDGSSLILMRDVLSTPGFVRIPAVGGKEQDVPLEKGQRIAPVAIGSNAINRRGQMLIAVSPTDSWFYRVVVLDLATGHVTPVKLAYNGDTLSGNWAADGRLITVGLPLKSQIWRFRLPKN